MKVPSQCPSCGANLCITHLECTACDAKVEGKFLPCPICQLPGDMRKLFDLFMRCHGNLKEVQRALEVSYPTVRQRISHMFESFESRQLHGAHNLEVLKMLRGGTITVAEAEDLIRDGSK